MRSIMHVDVNSAFLSWMTVELLKQGHETDYREVPAVVAGDPTSRHGIILASSLPAKRLGVRTAMTLNEAKRRCPELIVLKPDYDLYIRNSKDFYDILYDFSPVIERYSIDECYVDYTASRNLFGDPVAAAHTIKDRIYNELGFTANIGVSTNKLLAKMGSELEKPNKVHTLFPSEIAGKMWQLDIQELFFCGRATSTKLRRIGINTIGEIAKTDLATIQAVLKPAHGRLIHDYANGIDESPVVPNAEAEAQKEVSHATTLPRDVSSKQEAHEVLLAISERVGTRLRKMGRSARFMGLVIRSSDLNWYQHQEALEAPISTTNQIYKEAKRLFATMWKGEPVRQLGIRLGGLSEDCNEQMNMFASDSTEKQRALDSTVDNIRKLYGKEAIKRATLTNTELTKTLADSKGSSDEDTNYRILG